MIPAAVVIGGIAVGAKILGFLFDQLSEEERQRQNEIRQEQAAIEEGFSTYKDKLSSAAYEQIAHMRQNEANRVYTTRRDYEERMQKQITAFCSVLIENAEKQKEDYEALYSELTDTIKNISNIAKSQCTMLRRHSLFALLRELNLAKEKTHTYIEGYIKQYIKYIKRYDKNLQYDNNLALPKPFSFKLPDNYCYKGKLMYMKKEELILDGTINIDGYDNLKYRCIDKEFLKDTPPDSVVPVMCEQFIARDAEGNGIFTWPLSVRKGYFKDIVTNTPKIGIVATVVGYEQNNKILLDYNDSIELFLYKNNLENERRVPPIGAELRVYPIKWKYDLSAPVEVSERSSDSYLCYSFGDLPIVFSEEQWGKFKQKYGDVCNREGDWKIAPIDETNISSHEVKFQLDMDICFAAKIADNNAYFSFDRFLGDDCLVQPDDVFLGIDCVLNIYLDSDLQDIDTAIKENMTNLVLMCLAEFKVQYQIKLSRSGMQYFNKWAELTDRLITYLQKGGKHTEIKVEDVEKTVCKNGSDAEYRIKVSEPDKLKDFVDDIYSTYRRVRDVQFFFEMPNGIYCYVSIKGDGSTIYVSAEECLMDAYLKNSHDITLYQKNFPYPEVQQAIALTKFRIGKLANQYLQPYALNGSNIKPDRTEHVLSLFNERINGDQSQLDAVKNAFDENNIYLIQGPPGTGKTTVIREIILQAIKSNQRAKILVVSQANVAVDNVLKGLIDNRKYKIDFVRCGNIEKLDSIIEGYSFDHIYNQYISSVKDKAEKNPDNILLKKWSDTIVSEDGYNPNVGELIIRSRNIIGATCIGLAKKRIGLDRVTYDLVIIDEAGKALPAEILIPLIRGKKVILIGDHMQLPPTIHPALLDPSKIEFEDRELYEDELFNTSFFQRLYTSAPETNKCMLGTQYRMPSVIGDLISSLFYDGKLKNGTGTESKQPLFFDTNVSLLDISSPKYKETDGYSVTNPEEAKLVVSLLQRIKEKVLPQTKIAVITPYKGQKRAIQNLIQREATLRLDNGLYINTVDAFQGDEAEIVIFCCTRTQKQTIFFKDPRRINVAFSRAKNELIILGSLRYFSGYDESSVLPRVAKYIEEHGRIYKAEQFE